MTNSTEMLDQLLHGVQDALDGLVAEGAPADAIPDPQLAALIKASVEFVDATSAVTTVLAEKFAADANTIINTMQARGARFTGELFTAGGAA